MAEQHLDDADISSVLQKMGRKTVPQGVYCHMLAQTGREAGGTTGGVQHGRIKRPLAIATWKQPVRWSGKTPIGPQDSQKLGESIT